MPSPRPSSWSSPLLQSGRGRASARVRVTRSAGEGDAKRG
jgi:hypothetical protein